MNKIFLIIDHLAVFLVKSVLFDFHCMLFICQLLNDKTIVAWVLNPNIDFLLAVMGSHKVEIECFGVNM